MVVHWPPSRLVAGHLGINARPPPASPQTGSPLRLSGPPLRSPLLARACPAGGRQPAPGALPWAPGGSNQPGRAGRDAHAASPALRGFPGGFFLRSQGLILQQRGLFLVAGYQGLEGCSQTCGLVLVVRTPCGPQLLAFAGGVGLNARLPSLLLLVGIRPQVLRCSLGDQPVELEIYDICACYVHHAPFLRFLMYSSIRANT